MFLQVLVLHLVVNVGARLPARGVAGFTLYTDKFST